MYQDFKEAKPPRGMLAATKLGQEVIAKFVHLCIRIHTLTMCKVTQYYDVIVRYPK